jgi:amidophosphoribosyltransferase
MSTIVKLLREAGAAEIHIRVSSPPRKWPCSFGMDLGTREELLASDLAASQIREYLRCDTLHYLELDDVLSATGALGTEFCVGCVTGAYPIDLPSPTVMGDDEVSELVATGVSDQLR